MKKISQIKPGSSNRFGSPVWISLSVLAAACLFFMFAEIINHRFWLPDFEVYYKAAARILRGENLYRYAEDDHYIFKYSPVSALYFIPFTIMPFSIAKFAYWIFLTAVIIAGFWFSVNLAGIEPGDQKSARKANTVVFIAGLVLAVHFLRELHLGQVNYVLLFMYISAVYLFVRGRKTWVSLLLASSLFLKPFGLIFFPYLLLKKEFRVVLLSVLFVILIGLLPVLFYFSFSEMISQYGFWFDELKVELGHKQGLLDNANHTIFSVVARYSPVRFIIIGSTASALYQLIILAVIGFLVLYFIRLRPGKSAIQGTEAGITADFSLLIAWIPLLAFTSENAFIFSQPVVLFVLVHFRELRIYEKILAITGLLLLGGNFSEALGKDLSKLINDLSLVSIGAVILIYLLFAIRRRGLIFESGIGKTGK